MRILVADDHALMRAGIAATLRELDPQAQIAETADAAGTLAALEKCGGCDLALLDLYMPGAGGFELLGKLCDGYPDCRVFVISASESVSDMRRALDRGAAGYIPKSCERPLIRSAIELVLSGGIYIPAQMLGALTGNGSRAACGAPPIARETDLPTCSSALTDRQLDVLHLLTEGRSNKEMARQLGITESTVKVHLTAIFRFLGVSNRTQAVLAARARDLSSPD